MASRPKLKINIREKDLGMSHFLREAAKLRRKPRVKVGIAQAKGSQLKTVENEDGTSTGVKTVAYIAKIHEYGAPARNIPERSFIRSTVASNQAKYDAHIQKLRDDIFDANTGMTVEKALGLIGQEAVADIKNTIRNNQAGLNGPTALKEATVRRKNAGEITKANAHLSASPSAKDFTAAGSRANAKALNLVSTGGDSTPLIDTGQLVNSISYQVVLDESSDSKNPEESV